MILTTRALRSVIDLQVLPALRNLILELPWHSYVCTHDFNDLRVSSYLEKRMDRKWLTFEFFLENRGLLLLCLRFSAD